MSQNSNIHPMQAPQDLSEWGALFESLPGGEIIREGFADLQRGAATVPGLLVLIGSHRLGNLGLPMPSERLISERVDSDPEELLYDLLSRDDPDSAHSRYNALIRTLVSFERAAECAKK